jgi:hypothetical protein
MNLGSLITGIYMGLLAGIAFGGWIAVKWREDDRVKPAPTGWMVKLFHADPTNYRRN